MILRILDKSKNPISGLDNVKDLCVKSTLDFSDKEMSFSASWRLIDGVVVPEGYIETKTDRFVVKEVNRSNTGEAEVHCQLDLEDLEGRVFREFISEEQDVLQCVSLALSGTTWTATAEPSLTKKRTIIQKEATALDIIKQIIGTYRYEAKIDSLKHEIHFVEKAGSDKGVYFTRDLNLRKLTVNSQSYDLYTEIEPYGVDDMDIGEINGGKLYLSNYTYTTKQKRYIWKDERYSVMASLKEDAQAKLDDMAKPLTSYSAEIADLAQYSEEYSILSFGIGDTITLLDDTTGTREKQRIVGLDEYPNEPIRNTCTLANKTVTFSDYIKTLNATADTVDQITTDNGTIDGSTIDKILSRQIVDLENAIVESVYIKDLDARFVNVSGKLTAVEAEVGTLTANVANFEAATVQRLNAVDASITTLRTVDLEAANAKIGILDAGYADIKYLLAGNAEVDVLTSIVLTADNATIADALIRNGVVNKITINDLMAADIITNRQRILSNDGSFVIDGSTQTIRDENGNIRIQLGKDANGNFTFVLYDENGSGILIDASGIKESAIADGLIKNSMVAENAAIAGSKLDIASVFSAMNGSEYVLYANRIWFDEGRQTLNQAYNQLTNSLTVVNNQVADVGGTANEAYRKAEEASKNALDAIRALEGISSLDTLTVWLENDAHVVHTAYDGTGGDYTDAYTVVHVMRGDTEVTQNASITPQPSFAVTGEWDAATATYRVLNMSNNNGYVDFVVGYGSSTAYAVMPDETYMIFPGDTRMTMMQGTARLEKRFSLSKSPNGQVGLSIKLLADPAILQKTTEGALSPSKIKFSAMTAQGGETPQPFNGFFRIEETENYVNYVAKYISTSPQSEVEYTPSQSARMIRAILMTSATGTPVDVQTVTIIANADEVLNQLDTVRQGYVTLGMKVGNIESGIDGLNVSLQETNERINGITDGILLWSPHRYEGDTTYEMHKARVYRAEDGEDVTAEWNDDKYFRWSLRKNNDTTLLGYGTRCRVSRSDIEYGAVLSREFNTDGWPDYDPTQKSY